MKVLPKTRDNFTIMHPRLGVRDMRGEGILIDEAPSTSAEIQNENRTITGQHGVFRKGSTKGGRSWAVKGMFFSETSSTLHLMQEKVEQLFGSLEPFYIIFSSKPFKRYLVELEGVIDFDPHSTWCDFNLTLTSLKPWAESVGVTTIDDMTFVADVWGLGMNMKNKEMKYEFTTNTFDVFNAGDFHIDPRGPFGLVMEYEGAASRELTITNETTNEQAKVNVNSAANDVVKQDGHTFFLNNTDIYRYTNKMQVGLAPGWNRIRLSGTQTGFIFKVITRFFYES